MNTRIVLIHVILCLATLYPAAAMPDTVKLKNSGALKGIIKNEDASSITLLIGTGTMKIAKTQVESVERASEKENAALESGFRKKAIERGALVPEAFEETSKRLRKLIEERRQTDSIKTSLEKMKESFGEKRKKYSSLRADFDGLNRKIKDMDPASDVKRYNKYVSQMNMLHTEIESLVDEIDSINLELPERERAYWKAVTNYGNGVGDFRIFFEKKLEELSGRGLTQDEALYAKITDKTISDIEKGLNRDTVPLTKTAYGMTVKAVLNGGTTCTLAVDTGASTVLISKEVAERIETNPNETIEDVKFTLADGSVIKSKVIIIKSVRIGNSTVYDVPAAVSDNPPGTGIDGLLGMSFMNNFNIKLDVANERLILESVK